MSTTNQSQSQNTTSGLSGSDSKVLNFQHLVVIKKILDLLLTSYRLSQPFIKQWIDSAPKTSSEGQKSGLTLRNGISQINNIFQFIEEIIKLVPVEDAELDFDRIFYDYFLDGSKDKLDEMVRLYGKEEILSRLELYRFYYPHLVDKCDTAKSLIETI